MRRSRRRALAAPANRVAPRSIWRNRSRRLPTSRQYSGSCVAVIPGRWRTARGGDIVARRMVALEAARSVASHYMSKEQASILVVDDDPEIVAMLTTRLGHRGYKVLTASDGHRALELAKREKPEL